MRDLSTAVGVPARLIVAGGISPATNTGNVISNNELFNFNARAVYIGNTGDENWTISGNNIYEVNAGTNANLRGIESFSRGTNFITGNYIRDLVTTGGESTGILIASAAGTTTVSGNRITAFNVNATTTTVNGIQSLVTFGSRVDVINNQITLNPAATGSTTFVGLFDGSGSGNVFNAYYNSIVLGGSETGTRSSWASYRRAAGTHTARNNLFLNLRTGGTGNHFAAGSEITGGNYTTGNNVYAGTGATAANFMDFSGTAGTAVP